MTLFTETSWSKNERAVRQIYILWFNRQWNTVDSLTCVKSVCDAFPFWKLQYIPYSFIPPSRQKLSELNASSFPACNLARSTSTTGVVLPLWTIKHCISVKSPYCYFQGMSLQWAHRNSTILNVTPKKKAFLHVPFGTQFVKQPIKQISWRKSFLDEFVSHIVVEEYCLSHFLT